MPRLGFLLLLSIAACGHPAPDHAPPPPPGSRAGAIAAPAVPSVAVPFRWSAGPLPCETQLAVRAATATCARDGVEVEVRLGGTQLSIARVDRAQVAGHTRWSVEVALAAPATDPVVATIPQDGVVVAAATGADAIELAFVDLATGALRGRARVPVTATGPVQLERRHDGEPLRVHARTAGGGATALVDATTAAVLGVATTPAAAIRTRMDPAAVAADGVARAVAGGDAITAGWDDALVVRRRAGADDDAAPRWETTLIAGSGPFRSELVTLHVAGDLVVGTVHHPSASWTQVFAIDAADGAVRWRRTVTGIGPIAHSAYANHVASRVDGDLLVVQGVESGGTYVCTIDLATGAERACVDHLAAADVVAPAAPAHVPPPRPARARPLGPQVSDTSCTPSTAPRAALSVRRESAINVFGVITTPSDGCRPRLSGGIAGDRVELTVQDGPAPAGAGTCECRITFRQDVDDRSQRIVVTRATRQGTDPLVTEPVPTFGP